MNKFIADQAFKNQDYRQTRLVKGAYENCIFEGCNFEHSYLDNQNFMECKFIDCNLSNANIAHTIFKDVHFAHSKMMGLKFEDCTDLLMDFAFQDCALNFSSFFGLTLKNQQFIACKLIEVDFTEADLTAANFDTSNLDRATFYQTNLQKANFINAINFNIDPDNNLLKKAKFAKEGLEGLLRKHQIVLG